MEFITGPNGIISIKFKDLSPLEAAELIGGIIGHVYDHYQKSKVIVDIMSISLPTIPNQDDEYNKK